MGLPEPTTGVIIYAWCDDPRDAVARACLELHEQLLTKGFSWVLLRRSGGRPVRRTVPAEHRARALAVLAVHRARMFVIRAAFLVSTARFLVRNRRALEYVVSVESPPGALFIAHAIRVVFRTKFVTVDWVLDQFNLQKRLTLGRDTVRSAVGGYFEDRAIRSADRVITCGACMSENVEYRLNRASDSAPMWQDPRRYSALPPSNAAPMTVLYSGNASENHPLGGLVGAARLLAKDSGIRFVVAGAGSEWERTRDAVAGLGLTNIRCVPGVPHEELEALLASGDVHIASLWEPLTGTAVPSKVYAAMAASRPCVFLGSPTSQVALDLAASGSGLTVPSDDPVALADALRSLAADRPRAHAMGRAGARFFAGHRSLEVGAAVWMDELGLVREPRSVG